MTKIYTFLFSFSLTAAAFAQAPVLFFDINPGTSNASPSNLTVFNNQLFFTADDSSGTNTGMMDLGRELWVTDGTVAGTNIVLDIKTGASSSSPFNFFTFNNVLYFTSNDGDSELWTTDGTAVGTAKLDLFPAIASDVPNNALVMGSTVYLTTNQNGTNNQLTEWDGTTAVISPDAVNTTATTFVSVLTSWNGLLYAYMDYSPDEPTIGRELYSYDPATDTYALIKDIATGIGTNGGNNSSISNFQAIHTTLYFEAEGNLWQTDGTTSGTIAEPAAAALALGGVRELFANGTDLYFEAAITATDQLFKLDTVTGSIVQVSANANEDHNPSDFTLLNSILYYAGDSDSDSSKYLYSTDGLTSTQLDTTIKDIDDIVVFNNKLYFEGDEDTVTGNELFVYDPATASIDSVNKVQVSLYPNPNNGNFSLTNNNARFSSYTIYDLSGRAIRSDALINDQIQVNLTKGVYLLNLKGDTTTTIKFAVE
jgi:ELWxxDGT repeat protein